MITTDDISTLTGDVHDNDGDKAGAIGQVYLDNRTDQPEWVTVKTGLFGSKETFVPLAEATVDGNDVRVPYDKDMIKNAPKVDADGELSGDEEEELYRYYGLDQSAGDTGSDTGTDTRSTDGTGTDTRSTDAPVLGGTTATGTDRTDRDDRTDRADRTDRSDRDDRTGRDGVVGHDTSGPTTDDAMTRSEEQLRVGTRTEETGRARLRKHVVTEEQSTTVPVSREEVTVTREPITDANRAAAGDGPAISEEEHEVVLHAETPVVETEVVPVERISLGTETVREEQTVTGTVRKEQVEVDTDGTATDGSGTGTAGRADRS